ncbi:hypothetical protein D3795_07815 [Pseudidiomarina andamanensis]|uniref:ABC transporter substrate-binding protein n=2 Tax=Pseudidiomarina andamanensis TaxID=1940690 RepID=A0AA92EVM8_9GAMM|nr:transporter substrate-binding domain-containing protein [Pseudidiomarina andamanensis]MDS0219340.1 transporter substrate-binding domain-containing protein [Pseudidiomarina andamanensis]QGT96070.1 hypothetical protein D3795_07815 [Pseudidiomarina andamanensis]
MFLRMLCALLIVASTVAPLRAEQTTLTFRAPDEGPVTAAVQQILEEAYAELGITLRYVEMPRNRSLVEANAGRIAGELGRLPDLDKQFQNLTQVPFPLFAFEIVLVADRRDCGLCAIDDIENLAFISGMQTVIGLIKEHQFKGPTVQALDIQQLNLMFTNNRVKAVMLNDFEARQLGYYDNPHLIVTPMLSLIGYHFLHEKHAHLVPALNQVLEDMHASGRVVTVYREHGVSFERRTEFPEPPLYPALSATAGLMEERAHIDGTGRYWQLIQEIFASVTQELQLHTNSYQRAVLGFNENRFDMLVGGTRTQESIDGVASYTHFDYDSPVSAFALQQADLDAMLDGTLKRPICFVAGYDYHNFFREGLNYYLANSILDCFAMLDMHRVGAVVTFDDNAPDWAGNDYVKHQLREALPIHVMFHNTPRGRELRDWFDKRLRELVESGEITTIMNKTQLQHARLDASLPESSTR